MEFKRGVERGCQRLRNHFLSHSVFGGHFRERTKIQQKRPKFAGPIYFHAEVYLEVILESVRKSNKKGPNLPARFILNKCVDESINSKTSKILNKILPFYISNINYFQNLSFALISNDCLHIMNYD